MPLSFPSRTCCSLAARRCWASSLALSAPGSGAAAAAALALALAATLADACSADIFSCLDMAACSSSGLKSAAPAPRAAATVSRRCEPGQRPCRCAARELVDRVRRVIAWAILWPRSRCGRVCQGGRVS